jgi:murein DD-endopeptidase MepM/ murein hydrolase activator NlpD
MEQQPGPPPHTRPKSAGRIIAGLAAVIAVGVGLVVLRRITIRRPACGPDVPSPDSTFTVRDSLGKGEVLAGALARWCVPQDRINAVHSALAKTGFNFRTMAAGDRVTFSYRGLDLVGVAYSKDPVTSYSVRFDSAGASAAMETKKVDTVRTVVRGAIKGSLWNTMMDMGETPALVVAFAEILSYEVDFLTEVMEGDSFELLVDRCFVDSEFYKDGRVCAVHFKGQAGNYYGFLYRDPAGHWDYYNDNGQSLRKTVLRSPLQFAKVTSYFGRRYHPILRSWRQHSGIDYGAPTGTPVSAIADGTVVMARRNGGYGNFVEVRHAGGLVSCYGHLSRYGAGLRAGGNVRQGQTVGYVGMTGLATGPHLHFEVRQGGKPVNPLKVIPPRAEPVAKKNMPAFNALKASYLADLVRPAGPVAVAVDSAAVAR